MKIYTKTGDQGTTSLVGGKRISKAGLRIDSYGTVDELNAYIGLLRDQEVNANRKNILLEIQDRLFTIGSNLASGSDHEKIKIPKLEESDVLFLEKQIDEMDAKLAPLRHFILPGGHTAVSFGHIARTVCRRAERLVVALDQTEKTDPYIIKYLNRLSDYLFVLCRIMMAELGLEETPWRPRT
jgi:cob(I)alamin adenosyltransferase